MKDVKGIEESRGVKGEKKKKEEKGGENEEWKEKGVTASGQILPLV